MPKLLAAAEAARNDRFSEPAAPRWLVGLDETFVEHLRVLMAKHISTAFRRSPTGEGMCAPAAEISARIFQRRGHVAMAVRFEAAFANEAATRCMSEGREVAANPEAWSGGAVAPGYHAVTVVDRAYIFDPTSFQFSRPRRGLFVAAPLFVPLTQDRVEFELSRFPRGSSESPTRRRLWSRAWSEGTRSPRPLRRLRQRSTACASPSEALLSVSVAGPW